MGSETMEEADERWFRGMDEEDPTPMCPMCGEVPWAGGSQVCDSCGWTEPTDAD